MLKFFITSLCFLSIAAPALAKPGNVYPVSCVDLWAAVKDSLDNPRDYGILSMNDDEQKASFFVIGGMTRYTDRIKLTARERGCAMTASFLQQGSDDSDWRQFHHRLERSLAKIQAAKPKPVVTPAGQL